MKRIEIANIYKSAEQFADKEITVCGWVRTQRASKAIGFLEINDGGCFKSLQVVFEDEKIDSFIAGTVLRFIFDNIYAFLGRNKFTVSQIYLYRFFRIILIIHGCNRLNDSVMSVNSLCIKYRVRLSDQRCGNLLQFIACMNRNNGSIGISNIGNFLDAIDRRNGKVAG